MTRKITAVEVSGHVKQWIEPHLKLQDFGPKCTASVVLGLLLVAALKLSSIFAACRDLATAPSDHAIRNALNKQLPEMKELERGLTAALATLYVIHEGQRYTLALILRNVRVWLHYFIFADERGETPSLRLELLRFRRMLDRRFFGF